MRFFPPTVENQPAGSALDLVHHKERLTMPLEKCPVCGHGNAASATICAECHALLAQPEPLGADDISDTLRPLDDSPIPTPRTARHLTPLEAHAQALSIDTT